MDNQSALVYQFHLENYSVLPSNARTEQLWILLDRRNPSEGKRCYFPNSAICERTIKTLLKQNPEFATCPGDFVFIHIADVAIVGTDYAVSSLGAATELKEFTDYAD